MARKISEATPVVALAGGHKLPVLRTDGSNAVAEIPASGLATNDALATKASLSGAQTFEGAQRSSVTDVVSASNQTALNFALNNDFSTTLTENTTLANPTNLVVGQKGRILITQGATARTVAYGSYFKFPGGTIPAVSTTAGATDVLFYDVISATKIAATLVKAFA